MIQIHFLNLGAGVQSTVLYLMAVKKFARTFRLDVAGFADTQEEPTEVYEHLSRLATAGNHHVPILVRSVGKLGDDLIAGRNSLGHRFVPIPAFTAPDERLAASREGRLRRQCTKEYKTEVMTKLIRRELLDVPKYGRVPKDVHVVQYFGISVDEARRSRSIIKRFEKIKWSTPSFPLLEMNMTRADCINWLSLHWPYPVARSACVFCPYKSDSEWLWMKANDSIGWNRAVEIDRGLRAGNVMSRRLDQKMYLHRSCTPLELVELQPTRKSIPSFATECEGVCGV